MFKSPKFSTISVIPQSNSNIPCSHWSRWFQTAQKMKFSFKVFFSKCKQIHRKQQICSHFLNNFLTENCISCIVSIFKSVSIKTITSKAVNLSLYFLFLHSMQRVLIPPSLSEPSISYIHPISIEWLTPHLIVVTEIVPPFERSVRQRPVYSDLQELYFIFITKYIPVN